MKALSIRQPWAWLIANGYKDIENRTWSTEFRGRFLIHTGKTINMDGLAWCVMNLSQEIVENWPKDLYLGGIVGVARVTGCVTQSESSWFRGPYGFVISDARPLSFVPLKGQLKFFDVSHWESYFIEELKDG